MTTSRAGQSTRTAFVTGASGGIGEAISRQLLAQGWSVWGTSRNASRLEDLASHSAFHPLALDLGDLAQSRETLQKAEAAAGGINLWVNNAGYGHFARFEQEDWSTWQQQITEMIGNTSALVHFQVASLRNRGGGTLVNVSSLATEFPLPFMSGYNMAKAALSALSESLMQELRNSAITVIDFRPGDVRTNFNQAMSADAKSALQEGSEADMAAAWRKLEEHIQSAPEADPIAVDLINAVNRGTSGIVKAGGFFQARTAPFLLRLSPQSWARSIRLRYFGLS